MARSLPSGLGALAHHLDAGLLRKAARCSPPGSIRRTCRPTSIMRISLDCARAPDDRMPKDGTLAAAAFTNVRLFISPSSVAPNPQATGQISAASHDTATRSPAAKALPTKGSAATIGWRAAVFQRQVIAHHLAQDRSPRRRRAGRPPFTPERRQPYALRPHQARAAVRHADEVGDAQELRHEAVGRPEIGLGRCRDLLGAALVQHHDAIGQRQRLLLVVRHQDAW